MKCQACGYEHFGEWTETGYKHMIGDEKFHQIFTDHKFKIGNPTPPEHGDYYYEDELAVNLYACPKCRTVKMILANDDCY